MKPIQIKFNRGKISESSHQAKVLIKNIHGKTLISSGDDEELIYPRSSIKIFQAIPFIESNAVKKFKLNSKIIALSCSSHRGENFHLKELEKWLKRIDLKQTHLQCGCHYPLNIKAKEKLLRLNKKISELHNNCAGKHLAMLTSCKMNDFKIKNYLSFDHPHQVKIRDVFEKFSGEKLKIKNFGIDGCSAPQYSFKIKNIALLLINLIKSYKNKFENSYETRMLIDSIFKNPKFIGGSDSLDSRIMEISPFKIFCKGGAEGVFLFIDLKKELCGVIKIADGNERPIPYLLLNLFEKFNIMNASELYKLKNIYTINQFNHAGLNIGSIKTIV